MDEMILVFRGYEMEMSADGESDWIDFNHKKQLQYVRVKQERWGRAIKESMCTIW